MNLIMAILSTFTLLLSLIFVKDKPKTPPSFSSQEIKLEILESLK
jgi:hypothetical protein